MQILAFFLNYYLISTETLKESCKRPVSNKRTGQHVLFSISARRPLKPDQAIPDINLVFRNHSGNTSVAPGRFRLRLNPLLMTEPRTDGQTLNRKFALLKLILYLILNTSEKQKAGCPYHLLRIENWSCKCIAVFAQILKSEMHKTAFLML